MDRTTPPEVPEAVKAGGAVVAGVDPADVLEAGVNPAVGVAVVIAKVTAVAVVVIDAAVVAVVAAARRRKCKASSPAPWTIVTATAEAPATREAVALRFPVSICIPNRSQSARR